MKTGDVFFYKNFKFEDGNVSDKLLVLLAKAPDHKVMVVLTTSQQWKRELKDGCHASQEESYFTFNSNLAVFDKTTWIILKPRLLYEMGLVARLEKGTVTQLPSLKDVDYRAIVNCLKKSEDVSPFHLSLLN
jgi:hypothetical protein